MHAFASSLTLVSQQQTNPPGHMIRSSQKGQKDCIVDTYYADSNLPFSEDTLPADGLTFTAAF
jgi:hypothetical protein